MPGAAGTSALDFNGAAAIQWFGGTTNAVYPTAVNLRSGAAGNYIVMELESGSNFAVADNTTNTNVVVDTALGNFHAPSNSGVNNMFQHGNVLYNGGNGTAAALSINNPAGFPALDFNSPPSGQNQRLWDLTGFNDGSFQIRGLSDDAVHASAALRFVRAPAGANGYEVTSVIVGNAGVAVFFPDTNTFANLPAASNGGIMYCSDYTIANPCASGGTGAIAKRLNGTWVCN